MLTLVLIATVAIEKETTEAEVQKVTLIDTLKKLDGTHGGQCVEFVQRYKQSYYTHPEFRGWASNIVPNSLTPKIGDAVLLYEGPHGHAALIADIVDGELILAESNYLKNDLGIIRIGRRVALTSGRIRGYFNF